MPCSNASGLCDVSCSITQMEQRVTWHPEQKYRIGCSRCFVQNIASKARESLTAISWCEASTELELCRATQSSHSCITHCHKKTQLEKHNTLISKLYSGWPLFLETKIQDISRTPKHVCNFFQTYSTPLNASRKC